MNHAIGAELSSSQARDEILLQHGALRVRLAEVTDVAARAATSEGALDALRTRARAFYEALAEHMAFEERVLSSALWDVIGWGAVLQRKLEEDHRRQREILADAIVAAGPTGLLGPDLVESVRAFANALAHDMEGEERCLLQADIDALASDGQGG